MQASQHHLRIITSVILLLVAAVCIFAGGWAIRLLILTVSSRALFEFLSMYWPEGSHRERVWFGLLLGAGIIVAQAGGPVWSQAALCLAFPLTGVWFLIRYGTRDPETRLGHFSPLLHGLLYIPAILQLALFLSPAEQCLLILATMGADTGGYYAGTFLGRRKLWPSVSPKKTWEGLWGGMLLCVIVCAALGAAGAARGWPLPRLSLWAWALIGVLLHQAALFGDLFESAVKRSLWIKDAGNVLPGHGGVLDRIDGLLFVVPVYVLLRLFIA